MGEITTHDRLVAAKLNYVLLAALQARHFLNRMSDRIARMKSHGRNIPSIGHVTDKRGQKNMAYLSRKGLI